MSQLNIFEQNTEIEKEKLRFNGPDYVASRDNIRLGTQLKKILKLMIDNKWRSLKEISDIVNAPESSVSAQLRHLRKPRFGSYEVERKHLGNGFYKYKVN